MPYIYTRKYLAIMIIKFFHLLHRNTTNTVETSTLQEKHATKSLQVLLHDKSKIIITIFLKGQTYNEQNNTKNQGTPMEEWNKHNKRLQSHLQTLYPVLKHI